MTGEKDATGEKLGAIEEAVAAAIITQDALIALLIRKRVFTREEIVEEIRAARARALAGNRPGS